MLATLSDPREFGTADDGWIFERKLDGIRVLAVRDERGVRLLSRTGRRLNATYPEIVAALAAQESADFTVDGEIVAYDHRGRTDFGRLQRRMGLTDPRQVLTSEVAVTYCLFDLLRLDGAEVTALPLRSRKAMLHRALTYHAPLLAFLPDHESDSDSAGGGRELLEQACARGWEGLIAKRAAGRYVPGRSRDWRKLKCVRSQEFVVGGCTEPSGARVGFGSLLLGYYEGERLRYAGKAGTGFDRETLLGLRRRLDELALDRSPFADPVTEPAPRWARPRLVAAVAFTEWTRDGMLRHPRFLGLRDDKQPADVVRESAI
ncbi:non-homologous end-joining DNA ligase [Streptomyces paludis]|uniref:DNA ligase (ATP) n=1 Tax=Streptomyces paludis TaxID=2282738 RepID=A0A345I227_9ACTN|nr:non-homologous end-joining DNA ligase [Streptomyces paludis]AXG83001.1 ATP-dependent DNA ligase [Streptomyces paludis]